MNPILNKNMFFVKEHVGMFKASNNYDIYDPENNRIILISREPNLGFFTKMFRFSDYKRMTPFHIVISTPENRPVISIKRGITFLRSDVEVFDEHERLLGTFKQKFFSIGGKFQIYDTTDNLICTLQGKWTSWDFKFMKGNTEIARVSKKWAGLGKELFTSADNYMLQIQDSVAPDDSVRQLIMAAVMCIDMVLKE
ncbi:MAG: phospholipid scramblase-related protein [Flavobacterium sp.]|nr:phospholipid scramblase-related protein [Flavobacterium sp.]